jgi:hypothetical protein
MTTMHSCARRGLSPTLAVVIFAAAFALLGTVSANAQSPFRQISQDSFTNSSSQHMTEVEPSAAANGPVIVAAFQVGRISSGGGADIGWATSLNGGIAWTNGYLPGLTVNGPGGGPNSAASDAAVAYNAKFGKWLICTLPIGNLDTVAVSRSSDAIHWDNPIYVETSIDADKNWIGCDNTPSSPFYGNCYVEFDSPDFGDLLYMSTSTDGGVTWGAPKTTAAGDGGISGNPVVLPNGTVVVPFADFEGGMSAFTSANGGQSWTAAAQIAQAPSHGEAGDLRSAGLPSSTIDGGGRVYISWPDCSFESGCSANDIVFSSSIDGVHWTAKSRIPLDPVGSGVDHFINGMGADLATSGSSAHLGMTYYYYPNTNCGNSCQLYAGFSLSHDGGQTWTPGRQLTPPMMLNWLPNTFSGRMVADYVATAFPAGGRAFPIYSLANAPVNGLYQQAIYTSSFGYTMDEMETPVSSLGEQPIAGIKSDHPPRQRGELDNIPPSFRQAPPKK